MASLFEFKFFDYKDLKCEESVGWRDITYGYHWMNVGGEELFKYTDESLRYFYDQYESCPISVFRSEVYSDYMVHMIHSFIMEILPNALRPIPEYLLDLVSTPERALQWRKKLDAIFHNDAYDDVLEDGDLFYNAVIWQDDQSLYTGSICYAPNITFWSGGDYIRIRWDTEKFIHDEGKRIRVWTAKNGEILLPRLEFIKEVELFNLKFLKATDARILELEQNSAVIFPNLKVDFSGIHSARKRYDANIDRHLKFVTKTDWEEVIRANKTMLALT